MPVDPRYSRLGALTQDDALPGNLARTLAAAWDRGANWRAVGGNGATSRDIVRRYLAAATERSYDIVFVTIGANGALGLRSRREFRRDFRAILRRLRSARAFVRGEPGVLMSPPAPVYTEGFFASDRFHPSSQGYREWVEFALADAKLLGTS